APRALAGAADGVLGRTLEQQEPALLLLYGARRLEPRGRRRALRALVPVEHRDPEAFRVVELARERQDRLDEGAAAPLSHQVGAQSPADVEHARLVVHPVDARLGAEAA